MNLKEIQVHLSELETAQSKLQADQSKWRLEHAKLERSVAKLTAEEAVLQEKVAKANKALDEANTRIAEASKLENTANDAVEILHSQLEELKDDAIEQLEEAKALDDTIDKAKKVISSRYADITAEQEQKLADKLDGINQLISKKQDELGTILATIDTKQGDLAKLLEDIAKNDTEAEGKLLAKKAEAQELTDAIVASQTLLDETNALVRTAQFERDQAIIGRDKARVEHEQYKKYEIRARAELNAKDQSLQEREAELQTSEQFMRNKRTNLPPL